MKAGLLVHADTRKVDLKGSISAMRSARMLSHR